MVANVQFINLAHYYHDRIWEHAGRHDVGAESPTSWLAGNRKVVWDIAHILITYKTSNPASRVAHFLQQDHTNCTKAMCPNSSAPLWGYFLSNDHFLLPGP